MQVAVIGSGPVGTACIKALIRAGLRPTLIDIGERLPDAQQAAIDRMSELPAEQWDAADRALITANPTLFDADVPKKMVFGSEYYFGGDRPFSPVDTVPGIPSPSFARGGFSVAWGAALLPTNDDDLRDWPISRSDLESSYRRILADIPLSASDDGLRVAFPLYKDSPKPLPPTGEVTSLLSDLEAAIGRRDDFVFGRARLAVEAERCRLCGLCLSGCVYGAIYSTDGDLTRLQAAPTKLQTIEGWAVVELHEENNGVTVDLRHALSGEARRERFDRVFLAAGAIQSTRIVLASLKLLDHTVILKDSQKFIMPLLRRRRSPLSWPRSVALAGAFLDFKVPRLSEHWVHAQVSAVNDYVLTRLKIDLATPSLRASVLAPLYERLLVAWCGLHSDHSSGIALTLTSTMRDGLSVLRLRPQKRPDAERIVRRTARHLARRLLPSRTLGVTPALIMGRPGSGNHYGGTLPMRQRRRERLDTDTLGRLADWRYIHVVDGAIAPSIPATTLALLQMANADRIASAVAAGEAA